jgi:hypothetical protein
MVLTKPWYMGGMSLRKLLASGMVLTKSWYMGGISFLGGMSS